MGELSRSQGGFEMSVAKSKKTTGKAKSARTTGCLTAKRSTIEQTDSSTRPLPAREVRNHKSDGVIHVCGFCFRHYKTTAEVDKCFLSHL
jgi:hypothetical protein